MPRATNQPADRSTWIALEPEAGETLRRALERAIRDAIRSGALRAGVRLPASRELAAQLGVSRGVVTDAYRQLEGQGFLLSRPRLAPVVADVSNTSSTRQSSSRAGPLPPRFDFTAATPDVTLFPAPEWARAAGDALRCLPVQELDYGDPRGLLSLREALADHLGRTRGVIADPDQILIVQGAAQATDLLLRVIRSRGGTSVGVEEPSMQRQRQQVHRYDLQIRPWPVDDDGAAIAASDADAALLTPAHQFPTGSVLSGARRRSLLAWAAARSALLIEDDYDAEFRYDQEQVRALQGLGPDHVAYIGTASKTCAPALRLGWVVIPDYLVEAATQEKLLLDAGSPILEQIAFERLLISGAYIRHVQRTRAIYKKRRDRLVRALAQALPDCRIGGVAAGLHVWLALPEGISDRRVAELATSARIRVEAAAGYCIDSVDSTPAALVVGYGRINEHAIEAAVNALADVIRRVARGGRAGTPARAPAA